MVQVSIIIVSYNTMEVTRNCLLSIAASRLDLKYEIILVDNASGDGSVEMVRAEFPEVRVIANQVNNMFAKANNQGLQIARGDFCLLLNSDTIVEPGNIEKLYALIRGNSVMACVGPLVLNLDGTIQSKGYVLHSFKELFGVVFRPVVSRLPLKARSALLPPGHPLLPELGDSCRMGWLMGCCLLVRTSVFKELRGFDDEIFDFYCEEVDLCRRIWKAGKEVWLCPDAQIVHLGGASTSDQGWANSKRLNARISFYIKHFSLLGAYAYILLYLGFYLVKGGICKCFPGRGSDVFIRRKINRYLSELVAIWRRPF